MAVHPHLGEGGPRNRPHEAFNGEVFFSGINLGPFREGIDGLKSDTEAPDSGEIFSGFGNAADRSRASASSKGWPKWLTRSPRVCELERN